MDAQRSVSTRRTCLVRTVLLSGLLTLSAAAREAQAGWYCYTIDGSGGSAGRFNGDVRNELGTPIGSAGMWVTVPFVFYPKSVPITSYGIWTLRGANNTSQFYDLVTGHYTFVSDPVAYGDRAPLVGDPAPFGSEFFVPYTDHMGHIWGATQDTGLNWSYASVDLSAQFAQANSIAFNGSVYVFYARLDETALYVARSSDLSAWTMTRLEGTGGVNSRNVASPSAVVYNGTLRVYYQDRTNGDLREAVTSDGVNWTFSTLDGAGGPNGRIMAEVGSWPSAVATPSGLFVFHHDHDNSTLRYARFNGSTWNSFGIADGGWYNSGQHGQLAAGAGYGGASAVKHGGTAHVYYHAWDGANDMLRGAYWNGSSFSALTLDGGRGSKACANSLSGAVMSAPRAVELSSGYPRVYYAIYGDLRMAQYSP